MVAWAGARNRVLAWPAPRRVAGLVLSLMVLTAAADGPARLAALAAQEPILAQWADPAAQYRTQLAPVPYDLLRAADAALPRTARVLLVTSGADTRRLEYTTYHRALYFLAPRPVWWMVPTPSDGTWQARWWITAPLTPEAIRRVAAEHGSTHVLAVGLDPGLTLGRKLATLPGGDLWQLDPAASPAPGGPAQPIVPGALWPLQLGGAVGVMFVLGMLALAGVGRLGYRVGRVEGLALAWALGAGLTSLGMLGLNALGLTLPAQIALLTAVAVGGLVGALARTWRARRTHPTGRTGDSAPSLHAQRPQGSAPRSTEWTRRGMIGLLLLLLGAQALIVVLMATGHPLEIWDSWVNWSMKARTIFLEGQLSPTVYADPSRAVTQQDYPLLVPLVEAWVYGWLGALDDRLVGVPSVLFYAALGGVGWAAARARGASPLLALAATTALGTIFYLAGLAGIVFAELPVALFATLAGVYLVRWMEGGPAGTLALAAAGAGLLAWTKREGLILVLVLIAAALLVGRFRRRAWWGVGGLLVGTAVLAGPWWAFVAAEHIVNPTFAPITPATFFANVDRWPTIVGLTRQSLGRYQWSYLWPLAVGAGLLYWWRDARPGRRPVDLLPLAALLYIATTGFMYLFSAYAPYQQHILSSVDRLIAQVAPWVVIWIIWRGTPEATPVQAAIKAAA